jgi:uncharacterized protein YjbI with pentapeptide repeats
MAGLADDWKANRQTCVDVLCAYLRMPYEPDPGDQAPAPKRLTFQSDREVRHTIIRVITAHLRPGAAISWQGLNFDFTGVVFDGGDFSSAIFHGGQVSFHDAEFSGVGFMRAKFYAESSDTGYSGVVSFVGARFTDGMNTFHGAEFSSLVLFGRAKFLGGYVSFNDTKFSGGEVGFPLAEFSGSEVDFSGAEFSGSEIDFSRAEFSDGEVDFSDVSDWSCPPKFSWEGSPPPSVKLPSAPQTWGERQDRDQPLDQ